MARKPRRKSGGQPGNHNARKLGFYSKMLNPLDEHRYLELIVNEDLEPEEALLRLKLQSVLEYDPFNRRVILDACRIMAAAYSKKYDLNSEEKRLFKKTLRAIFLKGVGSSENCFKEASAFLENQSILKGGRGLVLSQKEASLNRVNNPVLLQNGSASFLVRFLKNPFFRIRKG